MSRGAASLAPLFSAAAVPVAAVGAPEARVVAMGAPEARETSEAAMIHGEGGDDSGEDVATAEQELGVDPSAVHADPGAEDAISLASCSHSHAKRGSGSMPGLLGALGLSVLLVRSRRRRSPS